jgi:hypothetical protein
VVRRAPQGRAGFAGALDPATSTFDLDCDRDFDLDLDCDRDFDRDRDFDLRLTPQESAITQRLVSR